jgi:glycerol-3-phosphate O-acyltransferase/dihydroxyacetone phosphate acyltransferase
VPWLYSSLRRAFGHGIRFFFLDIQQSGESNIPAHGATIFASNHPNSVMDTLVLGSEVPRTIHYLARSGLFRNPLVGLLLRGAGAIPISRRQDQKDPAAAMSNDDAFTAAYELLKDGGVLGIFPEGQNAPTRFVRDIKTGCARIGLGAEAAAGFSLDLRIIPVGLNYEDRDRFLSKVLVRFGEPIELRAYEARYAKDPSATAREVTDRLQDAMRSVATHVDEHTIELVEAIDALAGEQIAEEIAPSLDLRTFDQRLTQRALGRGRQRAPLEERFQVKQWIADAAEHFAEHEPSRLRKLEDDLARYQTHLERLRLRKDFAERNAESLSTRRESIRLMLYAILLSPIALYGLIHNFIPFRLARRFALAAPEEAMMAIRAFGGGFGFFGMAYFGFGSLAWHGSQSWLVTSLYLFSLAVSGVWFMRYRRTLQQMRRRILFGVLFRTQKRRIRALLDQRASLLTQVDSLRVDYEAVVRKDV